MTKSNHKKIPSLISGAMIAILLILILYLLLSFYFTNHYFFHTVVNGVNVSLLSYQEAEKKIKEYMSDYELQVIERNGNTEVIIGQNIGLRYNKNNSLSSVWHKQNSYAWIGSLLEDQTYELTDLFTYNVNKLDKVISRLNCINKDFTDSQNADFRYVDGSYEIIPEVYGNRLMKDKLTQAIVNHLLKGKKILDLDDNRVYEYPRYTRLSAETSKTKHLLNKFASTKIVYLFGEETVTLDGRIIHQWLKVNDDLGIEINMMDVRKFLIALSKKYDTVGIVRNFQSSTGKIVEVKGGIYGWKINLGAEFLALIENIKNGAVVEKEPIYAQKASSREKNDIGKTYIEINITRQHLWFYKEGKLICEGDVVTGNPNRGYDTVLGTYMINYKIQDATLSGPGYSAKVKYWMPFFGNIGLHDASWRYSFGGEIYKRRGSHGCVNAPPYLAKKIYENIEAGYPVICYEEE